MRYKGYYYDSETKYYWLNSRFYVPSWRRFLSPDSLDYLDSENINGLNLYAYCGNDPVNLYDIDGHSFSLFIGTLIFAGIGALVGAAAYTISEAVSYAITGDWTWSWAQFGGNIIGGIVGGILTIICPGAPAFLTGGLTCFSSTGFSMLLQNKYEGTNYSVGQIILVSLINGAIAAGATSLSGLVKIPGLNSGRNSYSAITKQMITKFRKRIISKITFNTFSKILTVNLVENIIGAFASGTMDAFDINDLLLKN